MAISNMILLLLTPIWQIGLADEFSYLYSDRQEMNKETKSKREPRQLVCGKQVVISFKLT